MFNDSQGEVQTSSSNTWSNKNVSVSLSFAAKLQHNKKGTPQFFLSVEQKPYQKIQKCSELNLSS